MFAFGGIVPRVLFPQLVNGSETIRQSVIDILMYGGEYWFLYTLFMIFLIFPVIEKALNNHSWLPFAIIMILSILSRLLPEQFCLRLVTYYLAFFSIGYLCRKYCYFGYKERLMNLSKMKQACLLSLMIGLVLLSGFLKREIDNIVLDIIEALIGVITCGISAYVIPELLKRFKRYSKYSLALYLSNGYWLVISRIISVQIFGTNAIFIITTNMIVDFYISYIVIKYILEKIPVARAILGIQG